VQLLQAESRDNAAPAARAFMAEIRTALDRLPSQSTPAVQA